MTREELIARIEAGETGPELLCAIAREVGWEPHEPEPWEQVTATVPFLRNNKSIHVPDWLRSLDAAVALVGAWMWSAASSGEASVCTDFVNGKIATSFTSRNPAAALVAAWLKATA